MGKRDRFSRDLVILACCCGLLGSLFIAEETARANQNPDKSVIELFLALSRSGDLLAVYRSDGSAQLWDVRGKRWLRDFQGNHLAEMVVAFSPSGKDFVSGGPVDGLTFWTVETGKQVGIIKTPINIVLSALALSPDGSTVAAGFSDGTLKTWDVASGLEQQTLVGHKESVSVLAFSPNGRWLASGSWDKTVCLWEVATGEKLVSLTGHTGWVQALDFTADSKRIASGGFEGLTNIWEVPSGRNLFALPNENFGVALAVTGVAFSPDGMTLAVIGMGGQGGLWNAVSGRKIRDLSNLSAQANKVSFSSDGKQLVVAGPNVPVQVLDPDTGGIVSSFSAMTTK
jgi:WD40 repeat protein